MKFQNIIVKPEEYQGNKFYGLYFVIEDKEYYFGTLKETTKGFKYVNCMRKEFKKN